MPNEPCVCGGCPLPECDPHCPGSGATVTLQQSDYDRLAAAERERDELRARIEEFRVSISNWLEVEIPGLKLGCEDCDQGHPKTCYACPDLLEALWIADDMYEGIMEERKNPKPGTPEKPLAKHGYAAVKTELASLRVQKAEAEAGAASMREALEAWRGQADMPLSDRGFRHWQHAKKLRDTALSSSTGREMLERVKRAEAVADAAVECRKTVEALQPNFPQPDKHGQVTPNDAMRANMEANKRFHAAVDAYLKGSGKQ